jgi:hypothetical protein
MNPSEMDSGSLGCAGWFQIDPNQPRYSARPGKDRRGAAPGRSHASGFADSAKALYVALETNPAKANRSLAGAA